MALAAAGGTAARACHPIELMDRAYGARPAARAVTSLRTLTRDDVLPLAEYEKVRARRRADILGLKRRRRVAVGPFATFHFENYDTMWYQVHEMLRIERGGAAQIAAELEAYAPLVPRGRELVATLMFEIDDAARRDRELARLGGAERSAYLAVAGERSDAVPESDVERTSAAGKTSSVHFLRFPLSPRQAARFKSADCEAVLGIGHPGYAHMAALSEAVRGELAGDLA